MRGATTKNLRLGHGAEAIAAIPRERASTRRALALPQAWPRPVHLGMSARTANRSRSSTRRLGAEAGSGHDASEPRRPGLRRMATQVVGHRVPGDASAEEPLNFGVDGLHAHLAVGFGQNRHDGGADGAELAPPVRPASSLCPSPRPVLVPVVTCETLEDVLEGVV